MHVIQPQVSNAQEGHVNTINSHIEDKIILHFLLQDWEEVTACGVVCL